VIRRTTASDQFLGLIISQQLGDPIHPCLTIQGLTECRGLSLTIDEGEPESESRWVEILQGKCHALNGTGFQDPTAGEIGRRLKRPELSSLIIPGQYPCILHGEIMPQVIPANIVTMPDRVITPKVKLTKPVTTLLET
jgi:hypothetical protein